MKICILQDLIDLIRRKITYRQFKRKFYKCVCGKIDYYKCNYDEIISLGYNCEVSQRLSDIFSNEKFEHYIYTWSYQYDRNLFIDSLNNLNNFINSNFSVLPWGMIKHEKFNIGFHSRYSKQELLNSDNTYTQKVPLAIEELKNRIKYLSEKLLNVLENKNNILFIIKLKFQDIHDDIKYISTLDKTIGEYFKNRKANYTILVVLSKENYPQKYIEQLININIKSIKFGIIESFAEDAHTDIDGDILGWYRLLKSYIKQI